MQLSAWHTPIKHVSGLKAPLDTSFWMKTNLSLSAPSEDNRTDEMPFFCQYMVLATNPLFFAGLQVMVVLIYLCALLTLYFIPLSITSPCIMDRGSLKAAPGIIGHQGAPMVSR